MHAAPPRNHLSAYLQLHTSDGDMYRENIGKRMQSVKGQMRSASVKYRYLSLLSVFIGYNIRPMHYTKCATKSHATCLPRLQGI